MTSTTRRSDTTGRSRPRPDKGAPSTRPARRKRASSAGRSGAATQPRNATTKRPGTAAKRSGTATSRSGTAAKRSGTATKRSGTAAKRSGTATSRSGTAAKRSGTTTKRSGTAAKAPQGRSSAAGTTTRRSPAASDRRPAARQSSRQSSQRVSARTRTQTADAPAPFRARRRDDDRKTRSRKEAKTTRRGKRSKKRGRQPVTDAGERNAAYLTATFIGLTLFGLVMVLSASSVASLHQYADSPFSQFKRQSMWVAIGAVAFLVTSRVNYRFLRPLAAPLLLVTIGLLVALFVPGVGIHAQGSTRWLGIGGFVIQPSELAKLVFIIFVADLLTRRERRMDRPELTIRPVMLILVLLSALMILQPKLGTPIILGAIAILMLFVAGARMRSLAGWLFAAVLAASLAAYAVPYRRDRLLAFLNPWEDPQGIGLQAIQSQVGIAEGGLFGVGLGASRAKWGFLPFAHTDFIFAIVAEEVGLIGASALIGGFLLIAWFGFRAAISAPDRFGSLLAAGITSWLLVQAFMNIGMVLGVLPITGEALPFVSAGGSSLVTMLAAGGLLTNVSRRSP